MTVQAQEVLEYKNEKFFLLNYPLGDFVEKNKKINLDEFFTTGNQRGYQGYWKIENEKLFLTGLESADYTFEEIFNSMEPIFADWFSGILQFGFGYFKSNHWWGNYENYLWLKIENGNVIEKRIERGIDDDYEQILNFGIYRNESVRSLLYGKITLDTKRTAIDYAKAIIDNFIENTKKVILPLNINITDEDYKLLEKINKSIVTYEVLDDSIIINSIEKEIAEQFSAFLEKVFSSVFLLLNNIFREARRQDTEMKIATESILIDNDNNYYLNWAIKNVDHFCYPPPLLKRNFNLKKFVGFNINRISNVQFEIKPATMDNQTYNFPAETLQINQEKYEKLYSVYYDDSYNALFYNDDIINHNQEFKYYLYENVAEKYDDEDNDLPF